MYSRIYNSNQDNKLESLLEESYKNQLKRHELMKEFLVSKIYVKGTKKGNELFLNYYEDFLLAFTSEAALQKAKEDLKEYTFCEVVTILRMMPMGIRILLNTGPNYGKEFLSEEISFLKEGKIPPDLIQRHDLKPSEKFAIYLPKVYPQKLIDVLFENIKKCPNVEKAYMAEIFREGSERANLIVGLKALELLSLSQEISYIAEAVVGAVPQGEYVDFVELKENKNSPIADFMLNKTKPFFDKNYF